MSPVRRLESIYAEVLRLMCGIVGVLDPRGGARIEEFETQLRSMSDTMVPRGPDGSGMWCDERAGIGFGHRRLAIIDLSPAGHQPMVSGDGRYVITYNGEIYNHRELERRTRRDRESASAGTPTPRSCSRRSTAGASARRSSESDGMFAFGLWDRSDRTLTLARDRLGEKPLFYGRLGSGDVVFGSSLDAIRAPWRVRPADRR